ncbi:MAG: hypothetical protein GXP61_11620 [Epsilonproteobacteria bacterium]|nr:hypothetical protein [Campylobacterota bacterium]
MSEYTRTIEEDEIDLVELFRTLMKRKWFIFLFTSIITFVAVIYAFAKIPMYEATALVEIGNYKLYNNNNNNNNNKVQLDDASQLSQKLNVLFIEMQKNQKNQKSEISSIKVLRNQKSFIQIKSLSISNSLATKEIKKVVNYIQNHHKKILEDVKKRREFEIKNIDIKISNIKNKEVKLINEKIDILENNLKKNKKQLIVMQNNIKKTQIKNPSLAALNLMQARDLTDSIAKLTMDLLDIKNKKENLISTDVNDLIEKKNLIASMLLPYNYKNSQIVGQIITNNYPVKPKKKLIVIVAFVTGLILSVFLVFFMEFIQNIKKENQ